MKSDITILLFFHSPLYDTAYIAIQNNFLLHIGNIFCPVESLKKSFLNSNHIWNSSFMLL